MMEVKKYDNFEKVEENSTEIYKPGEKIGDTSEKWDMVERKDDTWSNTIFDQNDVDTFKRLKCRKCGGRSFEVLITGDYETSAKCDKCGIYYVVHTG